MIICVICRRHLFTNACEFLVMSLNTHDVDELFVYGLRQILEFGNHL